MAICPKETKGVIKTEENKYGIDVYNRVNILAGVKSDGAKLCSKLGITSQERIESAQETIEWIALSTYAATVCEILASMAENTTKGLTLEEFMPIMVVRSGTYTTS